MNDLDREAFETWMTKSNRLPLSRDAFGTYESTRTFAVYEGWRAALDYARSHHEGCQCGLCREQGLG